MNQRIVRFATTIVGVLALTLATAMPAQAFTTGTVSVGTEKCRVEYGYYIGTEARSRPAGTSTSIPSCYQTQARIRYWDNATASYYYAYGTKTTGWSIAEAQTGNVTARATQGAIRDSGGTYWSGYDISF
ncbi:hypothetical protein [Promicromonospora sukumoe]|uniref:hypothetical protein n=1 Tax=Promicromonospora sukumoe TaxID=88382 RepID=UPI0036546AD6